MNPDVKRLELLSSIQEYEVDNDRIAKDKYTTLFEKIVQIERNELELQKFKNDLNVLKYIHFKDECENQEGYQKVIENDKKIFLLFYRSDGSGTVKEIYKNKEYYEKVFKSYLNLLIQ